MGRGGRSGLDFPRNAWKAMDYFLDISMSIICIYKSTNIFCKNINEKDWKDIIANKASTLCLSNLGSVLEIHMILPQVSTGMMHDLSTDPGVTSKHCQL